ncbi:hypothetical protein [Rickettsia sp. wb]|uniref:hypothetical protein n=1 Tax=Rickettsia sp. wb TaxID=1851512 RepID=UPI00083A8F9C|nr:hypothetical protein [Rickettsia sp. wb]ODA37840.1 hypothetical protein A8V33_01400 [Rickettsia sp. wb]
MQKILKTYSKKFNLVSLLRMQRFVAYISAVIIILAYNVCIYFHLQRQNNIKEQLLMQSVMQNINAFLVHDLETALVTGISDRRFILLSDFAEEEKNDLLGKSANTGALVENSTLYIKNDKNILIFPLQSMTNAVTKLIPDYILYTISINSNDLTLRNGIRANRFAYKQNINEQINIGYQFWINKDSSYYLNSQTKLNQYLIANVLISLIACSSLIYLYTLIRRSILSKIEQLENELSKEKKINETYLMHRKASQKLTAYFIKKATEELVRSNLKEDHTHELDVAGIEPSQYLFPIHFSNPKTTDISIPKLVENLEQYFAEHARHADIKYIFKNTFLVADCHEHVFFQLIYSLLSNILYFMDEQSDRRKTLEVHFKRNKMIIIYESFRFNETQMIKISNNHLEGRIDTFILNCERIFNSLKFHNLEYKVYDEGKKNIIEINYKKTKKTTKDNNQELAKVIDFSQFKYKNEEN